MTDGNLELVQVIVSWLVTLPAVIFVIKADERRSRAKLSSARGRRSRATRRSSASGTWACTRCACSSTSLGRVAPFSGQG